MKTKLNLPELQKNVPIDLNIQDFQKNSGISFESVLQFLQDILQVENPNILCWINLEEVNIINTPTHTTWELFGTLTNDYLETLTEEGEKEQDMQHLQAKITGILEEEIVAVETIGIKAIITIKNFH